MDVQVPCLGTCVIQHNEKLIVLGLRSLEESRWWVNSLRPSGGCNVMAALKQVLKRKALDSIILVLGSR